LSELRFQFIDGKGGEQAHLAAAILSDCLSRQGYDSTSGDTGVVASRGTQSGSDPERIFVVLAEDLLADTSLLAQLNSRSSVVVCSARPASTLRHELGRFTARVTTVDAEGIAADAGADPLVALLGGAARAVPLLDPDILGTSVWSAFDRSLPYAAQAAVRAFDQGYMQAQQSV